MSFVALGCLSLSVNILCCPWLSLAVCQYPLLSLVVSRCLSMYTVISRCCSQPLAVGLLLAVSSCPLHLAVPCSFSIHGFHLVHLAKNRRHEKPGSKSSDGVLCVVSIARREMSEGCVGRNGMARDSAGKKVILIWSISQSGRSKIKHALRDRTTLHKTWDGRPEESNSHLKTWTVTVGSRR